MLIALMTLVFIHQVLSDDNGETIVLEEGQRFSLVKVNPNFARNSEILRAGMANGTPVALDVLKGGKIARAVSPEKGIVAKIKEHPLEPGVKVVNFEKSAALHPLPKDPAKAAELLKTLSRSLELHTPVWFVIDPATSELVSATPVE